MNPHNQSLFGVKMLKDAFSHGLTWIENCSFLAYVARLNLTEERYHLSIMAQKCKFQAFGERRGRFAKKDAILESKWYFRGPSTRISYEKEDLS